MRKSSGSSLFLMELILVILFFSLASTACVQMFVKSHLLSSKSKDLTRCILHTQSLSESFYSTDGDLERIAGLFPDNSSVSDRTLTLYFDESWKPATPSREAAYQTVLQLDSRSERKGGEMLEASIHSVSGKNPEEAIYQLAISKFIPEVNPK